MTPIRRRIAERWVEAHKNAALLTIFNQVDMSTVIALRNEHQERFRAKYQIKLGFMSFFVKACIEAHFTAWYQAAASQYALAKQEDEPAKELVEKMRGSLQCRLRKSGSGSVLRIPTASAPA